MAQAQRSNVKEGSDFRQHPIRSPSTSSDITVRTTYLSVPHTYPLPAYIAQNAASELIASEIERTVLLSNRALTLVNEFLDQVLYNILHTSRSTSLSSLRAAIPTVLKPRLGKAALRTAEEELREYLDDDEELELQNNAKSAELRHDFDTELAWKLARLRCMVYTRLGDLEEEDEDEFLEQEGLRTQLQSNKEHSRSVVETGPASAIFLTSVMEYLGEQALYYAAQHAQKRSQQNGDHAVRDEDVDVAELTPGPGDVVVGGRDMNHVGRDSPLSRLWRSYRRNTRESGLRSPSPDGRSSVIAHGRTPSYVAEETIAHRETRDPDQIPLPMSGNDVNEIEVPGLASAFSEDEDTEPAKDEQPKKRRPTSMLVMPGQYPGFGDVDEGQVQNPAPAIPARSPLRPLWMRKRSLSSPVHSSTGASPINHDSQTQEEYFMIDSAADDSDQLDKSTALKRPSSSHGEGNTVRDVAVGGATAAVAGALGIGALGTSNVNKDQSRATARAEQTNHVDASNITKKTVAEEMLGTSSVAPPKDAKTGSSITNVSDFYSMHVPVEMPSSSSLPVNSLATPGAAHDRSYSQAPSNASPEQPSLSQVEHATENPQGSLRPAPLRTLSGRKANSRPSTATNNYKPPTTTIHDDVTVPAKTGLANSSRPQSSAGKVITSAVPAATAVVPPRITSREDPQSNHTKTDSQGSNYSLHTKHFNSTKDARPSTAASSMSKRFHGKPLHVAEEDDEAKKKSLEILIRGNETLHYTLTPAAAMRDESANQKVRTPNQDMAEFLRHTGPRNQELNNRNKLSGLASNPPDPPRSPTRPTTHHLVTPSSPVGAVSPASPTRAKNPLGEPRDARTESTARSTRDLADYARSTGPDDTKQLPKAIAPKSATSPRLVSATPRADNALQEPASPNTGKAANRLKYQARDARPSRADDTSQLIDFIREGPPRTDRDHRISRKVAPFRTTMDSEDFNNLQGGREAISSLRESEDGKGAPSVDRSINSQSPLIGHDRKAGKATSNIDSTRNYDADTDNIPKRTRRRIKDPYAIYDSDDDEELEAELASGTSKTQEESLIDFLRNTGPTTSTMTAQPVLTSRADQRSPESRKSSGARESSPHLTQTGSKRDVYRPTQPTHAAHVDRNRSQARSENRSENRSESRRTTRFEARDAKATRTDTSELAEYLKNSGPAPNAQYRPQPFILSSATQTPPKAPVAAPAPSSRESNSKLFKRFSKVKK